MRYKALIPSLFLFIFMSSMSVNAQKPEKTHDHERFAKKVIKYMLNDVTKGSPDEEAIQYIHEKTGQDIEALKAQVEANNKHLKADVDFLNENGIYRKLDETELKIIKEKPIKVADIILHCEFKGDKIDLTLKNCIQTNRTWVLGDAIELSGEGVQEMMDKNNARKEKPSGGLLGKITELDQKQNEAQQGVNEFAYQGQKFIMKGTQAHTVFYNMDLIGQYLDGYIVDKNYIKQNLKILYEAPELLQNNNIPLKVDIDRSKTTLNKPNAAEAFYVGGQLFVFTGEFWDILLVEGAINKLGRVARDKTGNYLTTDLIQKTGLSPESTISLSLNFKTKMSQLVKENKEMAQKILDKEDGYRARDLDAIIREYNLWYEENFPNKIKYIFEEVDRVQKNLSAATEPAANEEAPANIPSEFSAVVDTWVFSEYFKDGIDQTSNYEKGKLEGKPIKITLMSDGSLFYQGGYRKMHNINYAEWKYFDEQSRNPKEKEIDFVLVQYHSGGSKTIEKFAISKVTANQLVLENKYEGIKLVYVK
ncbi:hypothetical protein MATR_34050 [Marivirga tractuosa]|uniref:DUF3828 domain-containing protein n=1 Tax=Marivirga tractuosa (strain ATCC 23168 / DSM 4126 / NBRC 15989 / NCIMB 1408 / VKM B-1430 / H-43) TaxID=643867 RepID=E4TRQ0_MARTH|nr:hypothetical protein [Marivirga tractuosa]ADR22749.1 hypothetical protein Ftrac_2771 [Marivirga tractuosa DSM 4126]BDD16580.1 hypothetical protein MATR_34050 [Marivirga tractuosa]